MCIVNIQIYYRQLLHCKYPLNFDNKRTYYTYRHNKDNIVNITNILQYDHNKPTEKNEFIYNIVRNETNKHI